VLQCATVCCSQTSGVDHRSSWSRIQSLILSSCDCRHTKSPRWLRPSLSPPYPLYMYVRFIYDMCISICIHTCISLVTHTHTQTHTHCIDTCIALYLYTYLYITRLAIADTPNLLDGCTPLCPHRTPCICMYPSYMYICTRIYM